MSDYNGWTNYETWLINVWLDNDEMLHEMALDALRASPQESIYDFGKRVREFVETLVMEEVPTFGLVADLLGAALSEVNWRELAEAWMDDAEFDAGLAGDDEEEDDDAEFVVDVDKLMNGQGDDAQGEKA